MLICGILSGLSDVESLEPGRDSRQDSAPFKSRATAVRTSQRYERRKASFDTDPDSESDGDN
ncbi:hypothetical protein GCM10010082_08140 [Kushneria pakistanensis]|uniref:Uncharacterized protein n=1 Tax=Kushneria pakistanensis TaxID=1508770 RepID=A0ABQ3FCW0_9GAMM|nr:hypothetical protein GCM10010082_08140 [Kushneria pakistanensis]